MLVDTDSSIYIGANSFSAGSHGKQDVLVIKLNSAYVQQWGKFWGSTEEESTGDIAVSTDGVYITGNTNSPTLTNGDRDIFLLKLSKTDGSKIFATLFGSANFEFATSIQVVGSAVYVGGYSGSTGWTAGSADFLLVQFSTTGTKQWSRHYGHTNSELISDIIVSGSIIYAFGAGDIGAGGDDLILMQASTADGTLSLFRYLGGAAIEEASKPRKTITLYAEQEMVELCAQIGL